MDFEFETHWDQIHLLPMLSACAGYCPKCDEAHGVVITAGWLFWNFNVVIAHTGEE